MRITPENIQADDIKDFDVFVFGSNESGMHGAGAAFFAMKYLGARKGQGFGFSKNTFAIPTKDWDLKTLPLNVIQFYVERFIEATKRYPHTLFYVTQIGCGLAGYTPQEIAPMFKTAMNLKNVYLPQSFWDVLFQEER